MERHGKIKQRTKDQETKTKKNQKTKKNTKAAWTTVSVSHPFRLH
jgi:hypothetical protein